MTQNILLWGTYDLGKPRVRIMLSCLQDNEQVSLNTVHYDLWQGVEDKTALKGPLRKAKYLLKWLSAYPGLMWRYIKAPRPAKVLIGYMGLVDVFMLAPFAWLRRTPIVWDMFLSTYDTVVNDRRLISRYNPLAWCIYMMEWLACRMVSKVVLDTKAHADYIGKLFHLPASKVTYVYVGAEKEYFYPAEKKSVKKGKKTIKVLFYGQFIPLHGIETIIKAAQANNNPNIHWKIIGSGQEEEKIREMLKESPVDNLEWIKWAQYEKLREHIVEADICLGIFGTSEKAGNVIPNKVFQYLYCGKPVITRDSPAIREIADQYPELINCIPAGDHEALLGAVGVTKKHDISSQMQLDLGDMWYKTTLIELL